MARVPTPDTAAWAVLKLCADLDLRPGYALPLDKLFLNNANAGKSRLTNEEFVGGVKLGAKCEWFETSDDKTYSLTEAGYKATRRLDPERGLTKPRGLHVKAFISYSHTDEQRRKRLETHLAVLGREGRIEEWFDRKILAGSPIDAEIDERIEWCELFLPLVSPDFLASDYCYEREMSIALERHRTNDARVVPIIIEPCDWRHTPLGELKAVPSDGKPVALWDNENHAFLDVVTELRRIITAHHTPQTNLHGGPRSRETVVGPAMRSTYRNLLGTVGGRQPPGADTMRRGGSGGHHELHGPDGRAMNGSAGERPHEPATTRRYRMQRDFDEIDRAEFREAAFAIIREHFDRGVGELTSLGDVRARFVPRSETSFSCTVVNKARDYGTAHITVHSASGERSGVGDISYSHQENSPPGTANGFFTIVHDEYELYLQPTMMVYGDNRDLLTPQEAAETIWTNFIEQAGIFYC